MLAATEIVMGHEDTMYDKWVNRLCKLLGIEFKMYIIDLY